MIYWFYRTGRKGEIYHVGRFINQKIKFLQTARKIREEIAGILRAGEILLEHVRQKGGKIRKRQAARLQIVVFSKLNYSSRKLQYLP